MIEPLETQFHLLRARIETTLTSPFVLLITSASLDDGKSLCASGLAESMALAGYRTLLVDLDCVEPSLRNLPQMKSFSHDNGPASIERFLIRDPRSGVTMLSLSDRALGASASKIRIAALVRVLRSRFDAIVFDAARFVDSGTSLLAATECDAVVFTTREGRAVRRDDRIALEIVRREKLNLIGFVTVGTRAIHDHESRANERTMRYPGADSSLERIADVTAAQRLVES